MSWLPVESVTSNPAFKFGYTVAIAYATTILLNMNEGWDSAEYTRAAVDVTAQVAAQYGVSSYFGGSAVGAGVGAAAAYMVSAGINDMRSDDHMDSHQWQTTIISAVVIGVAAAIGAVIAGPIGAVVATIIVSEFMGGKEYNEGEYGDPSLIYKSLYQISTKADGSGLEIIGVGSEGVTLKASQNGVDDIYGSNSSDNGAVESQTQIS